MEKLFRLPRQQMAKMSPFFHDTGGPRGDDRRVISGIPAGLHHGEQ